MQIVAAVRVIKTTAAMQRAALAWKRRGCKIGFVPTMGYLHEGHASLIREARRRVSRNGIVVVSIYVNPMQFSPTEDLSRYPRDFARDKTICTQAGADAIFFPTDEEMYPRRGVEDFSTYVVEENLSRVMEGASRPSHFRGVTTVVAKLFNIVLSDVAVFGAKDFQQAAIIKRMVSDLNFPLKVIVAPTVREPDGLAMSSRNKYLDASHRRQAIVLWQAIQKARAAVRSARRALDASRLKSELKAFIEAQPAAHVDYIEIFDPRTLKPVERANRGAHLALAVFVGTTRLIDNARL